jgi:raffinose/stachyose/melibiose transport system permease protein
MVVRTIGRLLPKALLALLLLFALGPFVIIAFNSVKSGLALGSNALAPPMSIRWENFGDAWDIGRFATTTRNSLTLVFGTVAAVLPIAGLAAYAMTRLHLRREGLLVLYLLGISTVPIQLFLVPLFFIWRLLGLTNNLIGVIIIYAALQLPFAIFLLRSYMVQLPIDFDEAARVDGASDIQILWKIVVPLSMPGFLTVGLVVALFVWKEFMIATVFLTDPALNTVVTSYANFDARFSTNWALTSAGAMIMILPVILLFILLQRRFIEGLASAGLRG